MAPGLDPTSGPRLGSLWNQHLYYSFDMYYICHGRKSNLVEFQILPVESPIGVSTSIESPIGVSTNINLVENPIKEIWVLPWGPNSNKLVRQSNCSKSGWGDNTASFTCWDQQLGSCDRKCCCRSIGLNGSTKCHVESDCCQNLICKKLYFPWKKW